VLVSFHHCDNPRKPTYKEKDRFILVHSFRGSSPSWLGVSKKRAAHIMVARKYRKRENLCQTFSFFSFYSIQALTLLDGATHYQGKPSPIS
jgi:hypothetical protein